MRPFSLLGALFGAFARRREERTSRRAEAERKEAKRASLRQQMDAERKEHDRLLEILRWDTLSWRQRFPYSMNRFQLLMLGGTVRGYYLAGGSILEYAVADFSALVGKGLPAVMIMEATWRDHKVENAIPGECYFVAEAEGTERHEMYLFWDSLPRWRCLSWDENGVVLQDLFGKTITLPQEEDMIAKVLRFVTWNDSYESYVLLSIAGRSLSAICKAAPSRDLQRVRIALTLRGQALNGQPFTDESWDNLLGRDPTKR